MNHFKECLKHGTDFYEMGSGNLFHIAEYVDFKNKGLRNPYGGIRVTDGFGHTIGVLEEKEIEKFSKWPD